MTAQDVQLTDFLTTANVPNKNPLIKLQAQAATPKSGAYRDYAKHLIDALLVVACLPFVLPVVLLMALVIAKDGGQPFYSQSRIGKDGRIFRMWKLRTMVPNADAVLESYLAQDSDMRAEWDSKQKLLDDPRVTSIGHFLRRSSIDELPQLFNVLKGDMSLVGPRPMMVDQKKLYPGRDYYDLRPGITGFWQISDRNNTSFADRAHYDARYNKALSFKADVNILLSTVRVVLKGTGC